VGSSYRRQTVVPPWSVQPIHALASVATVHAKKRGRVRRRGPFRKEPNRETYLISTLRGCAAGDFVTDTCSTPLFISAEMLSASIVSGNVNERVTLP
jgi:hypothetical protein